MILSLQSLPSVPVDPTDPPLSAAVVVAGDGPLLALAGLGVKGSGWWFSNVSHWLSSKLFVELATPLSKLADICSVGLSTPSI